MDEERNRELRVITNEKTVLDEAMERISELIQVRRAEEADGGSVPIVQVSTPGSSGITSAPGSHKRKRRTSLSVSASPVPPALSIDRDTMSPLPPRSGTPSTAYPQSAGTKNRRDGISDQLPLQPGRKVAFKVPAQKTGKAVGPEEEDWILATIKRCIGGDRSRYEVQDADDSNQSVLLFSLS